MSYQRQTFVSGEIFTAAELAHIEAGVAANDAKATELAAHANALSAALNDITGWETYDRTQTGQKDSSTNKYAWWDGVTLLAGQTLRIRNISITQIGNASGGVLNSFKIYGLTDANASDPNIEGKKQICYRSASQVNSGDSFQVTVSKDYLRLLPFADAKSSDSGNNATETFRIQFEYKIDSATSGGSSSGTYAAHNFQNGDDLYPDELDDMEAQIAADDSALAAAETRLNAAAASAAELLPWKNFSEEFSGSKSFELPMVKGQTLAIKDLSITLASGTPTSFKVQADTKGTYDASTLVMIAQKSTFEDFTVTIPGNFTHLRVNAEPSSAQQTISFKYKLY